MAGPSIVVRVLGDLVGLNKSLDTTAKKSENVSKSISKNFSTMFSGLNATGVLGPFADVFDQIQQGFNNLEDDGHRLSSVFLGLGVAAAGVGAALTSLGSADQAAQQQLAQAIDNTGASWSDYKDQVEAAIKSEVRYGNNAAETQNALQSLTQATNNPTKALNLLSLATDLAAAHHESLTEASRQLARIMGGSTTRILKEFGIEVPKVGTAVGDFATKADQTNYIITQLSTKLHGQAAAAADTFTGHVHALATEAENAAAAFGQHFGPALTVVGTLVTAVSSGFKIYESVTKDVTAATEAATAATEARTAATEALTVAETEADVAGAPLILTVGAIAAAVAALGVVVYEIATHWKAIWSGIKAAVVAVWDWIKRNWPLLVGILLGPMGFITAELIKNWHAVWDVVKAVAHGIVDAFKVAFNFVADIWNDTIGSLHFSIPHWVPLIGGDKFAVPQIPHLAEGGLITQTGFVYAHAGEAITPVPSGIGGPSVYIEHAQFNDPVDIDLLIKKVEFALSAGLPV